jgi:predicted PurR-regulated permease PerM
LSLSTNTKRVASGSRSRAGPEEARWPSLAYWAKVVAVVVATFWVMMAVRSVAEILLLLAVSLVLAVGMDPLVVWLAGRLGISRGRVVVILGAAFAALVVLVAVLVVPAAIRELGSLSNDLPVYLARVQAQGGWAGSFLQRTQGIAKAQAFLQGLPGRLGSSFGMVLGIAGRVGTAVLGVATVFALTGYFMVALPRLRERAMVLLRPDVRERAEPVIELALVRIGGYVTGNFITSGICALAVMLGLIALRVPFAIPLGIWAGFADLIPMVGSYAGAIPAIVIAFFVSPMTGLLTAVFYIAYQQFENYVLVPRVMKNAVHLSFAAVMVSTLIGGTLAGFAGALLALPVAATIKVIVIEIWLKDRASEGDDLARKNLREIQRQDRAGS